MAPNAPASVVRHLFALFRDGGLGRKEDRPGRLAVCSFLTWRTITTTDDLTERDIRAIGATLEYWKSCGAIEYRCQRIATKMQEGSAHA